MGKDMPLKLCIHEESNQVSKYSGDAAAFN
jgi:hypothetical protein